MQTQAHELAAQRKAATGAKRGKLEMQLRDLLIGFATELAHISVLDPACGSGNFLYLALVLLLDLWKEVSNFMAELGYPRLMPLPDVAPSLAQLHGIEKDEYAHELARTTIWIGYIQWFVQNGFGFPPEPILRPIDTIVQMDAILEMRNSEGGMGSEPEWPTVDVIVGNPPFLGGGKIRAELGNDYTEALFKLYGDRLPNFSDLVCYWFEKARAMIASGKVKRAGLLATQAIRAGASRHVLDRIKETGNIFWARSEQEWSLDDALLRVSMIGFDNGSELQRTLNDQVVSTINADLTTSVDMTHAQRLEENAGICYQGPSPKAPFDIENDVAQSMLSAPVNPNGRSNRDVIKLVASALDIAQSSRNVWTIDFGLLDKDEAAQYILPFEYVKKVVLPARETRRDDYRGQWWQYARPRPEMRKALIGKARYVATPRVSKHRFFVWLPTDVLANDRTFVFARDDDYFFGVLQSRIHEVWSLATSSRHGVAGDIVYNNTTCFETFPFPWPLNQKPGAPAQVNEIGQAAAALVKLRDALKLSDGRYDTLTKMYNEKPEALMIAHRKLDAAVFAAYGWPADLSDDEILARLLALNLERATG